MPLQNLVVSLRRGSLFHLAIASKNKSTATAELLWPPV